MQAVGTSLRDYFERELHALRNDAAAFSAANPLLAQALALNKAGTTDPHVALLTQSFAFLTGRLQYEMEVGQAALPNALLGYLHPHLEASLPSMMVAQLEVKPDGANFANGVTLERGRHFTAAATDDGGRRVSCRFRTCFETPLMPVSVVGVTLLQPDPNMPIGRLLKTDMVNGKVRSVLRVRLKNRGREPLKNLHPRSLRFYIDTSHKHAYRLHEMLASHLVSIGVQEGGAMGAIAEMAHSGSRSESRSGEIRWLGYEETESALPTKPGMHPGYRLLQEYFAFPEKFLFFEVDLPAGSQADDALDLLFFLDLPHDKELVFSPDALRLNCVPLVNLFSQRLDPLRLDHTQYEYRLRADLQNHRYCEIHTIEELTSAGRDGSQRAISPYFDLTGFASVDSQDYFYAVRREQSQFGAVSGTETYVSFLDSKYDPVTSVGEAIGGSALCTNRQLPGRLRVDDPLYLEGPGSISGAAVASQPTPHQTPVLLGSKPWALASQLSLNHLSLADGPAALGALKEMLDIHIGRENALARKQIQGLREISCRPVVRHVGREGWRGFAQGLHVRVLLDRADFVDGSVVLFCEVLRRFFALYAAINTLVELSLETTDTKGTLKEWPPLIGTQPLI